MACMLALINNRSLLTHFSTIADVVVNRGVNDVERYSFAR